MIRTCSKIRFGVANYFRIANNVKPLGQLNLVVLRYKYTQHNGVKGLQNKKNYYETAVVDHEDQESEMVNSLEFMNLEDRAYDEIANGAMFVTRDFKVTHNVLILQPYIKWKTKRQSEIQPEEQLKEAEALIRSLPNWQVSCSLKVPLESLERKTLFGSGKIEELKQLVQQLRQAQSGSQKPLTCLFVSKSTLSFAQKRFLEAEFKLPVMDRYSVVIQILRLHATTSEARLQVAMAELPYIWSQAKDANVTLSRKQGFSLNDAQREVLKTRERKLKLELEKVRTQRKLLRNKRKHKNFPTIAVVGYTNAGKTSLIKALTEEKSLQPRDQLFATLDVTAHAGVLPSNLEVIYMDTVGFMSDLPTGLIECFVSTLEDAMLADIIIHVQDLSHNCYRQQRKHVEDTLTNLIKNIAHNDDIRTQLPPIINVANKIDLLSEIPQIDAPNIHLVSTIQQTGLNDLLIDIEKNVLAKTGRRKIMMRIRNGGNEMAWLYKNAAVVKVSIDSNNAEILLMDVIIMESTLQQFKKQFCQ